jgi:hypothetical protein
MATWQEVKSYLKSNYKIRSEEDDFVSLVFETGDGRSQLIFVAHLNEWIRFSSPIAKKAESDLATIVERAAGFGIGIHGMDWYGLVHMQLLATVDSAEIDAGLDWVTAFADEVEKAVSSEDIY